VAVVRNNALLARLHPEEFTLLDCVAVNGGIRALRVASIRSIMNWNGGMRRGRPAEERSRGGSSRRSATSATDTR
jgi:hypothetical protein